VILPERRIPLPQKGASFGRDKITTESNVSREVRDMRVSDWLRAASLQFGGYVAESIVDAGA